MVARQYIGGCSIDPRSWRRLIKNLKGPGIIVGCTVHGGHVEPISGVDHEAINFKEEEEVMR